MTERSDSKAMNIVLVHGAWADGSGWEGVYRILTKDGYRVSVVQHPTISLADDVAATRRVPPQAVRPGTGRQDADGDL